MIRYVLDTNAASALMRSDEPLVEHVRAVAPEELALPQPVVAEIACGIERLPRSRRRDKLLMQWERIRGVLARVSWTDDVSARFGEIKAHLANAGLILEDFDIAVAAHALSIDAVLVTANLKHMRRVPRLRIEDWSK